MQAGILTDISLGRVNTLHLYCDSYWQSSSLKNSGVSFIWLSLLVSITIATGIQSQPARKEKKAILMASLLKDANMPQAAMGKKNMLKECLEMWPVYDYT